MRLIRNSNTPKCTINVTTNRQLQLGFTKGLGVINDGTSIVSDDHKCNTGARLAAQMLSTLLTHSAERYPDARLDIDLELQANKLIDETLFSYNSTMLSWLKRKLFLPVLINDDLQYALREILLVSGSLPNNTEAYIDFIQNAFSGEKVGYWHDRLNKDSKLFDLLRKIASSWKYCSLI
jgi:hypothetical protein